MAGVAASAGAEIGRLAPEDVAAAAELSAAIGWNQDEADWARLVTLDPEGAFAARVDGVLVGTTTLVRYGDALGWLGMVIVHPSRRGAGLGSALVDAALTSWHAEPGAVLGLDATELGAPLYARRGFEQVATIDRWQGVLKRNGETPARLHVSRVRRQEVDRLGLFDTRHAGVDRTRLLARLVDEPGASVYAAERAGDVVAFAALRSGRERKHVGPVVAADTEAMEAVLNAVAASAPGEEAFLDAVRLEGRSGLLERFGLRVARSLKRMTLPADPRAAMCGPALVAATGLEWG